MREYARMAVKGSVSSDEKRWLKVLGTLGGRIDKGLYGAYALWLLRREIGLFRRREAHGATPHPP